MNFPTLRPEHLRVVVDGVLVNNYTATEGQIIFNEAPPEGQVIVVFRVSPQERIVDFENTAMLNAAVMDTDSNQLLFMIQEALANAGEALRISWSDAGAYDANGLRITNLGDPKLPSDAVNKDYTDKVLVKAKEFTDRAEQARDEAEQAREGAEAAQEAARQEALSAKQSAESAERDAQETSRLFTILENLLGDMEPGAFTKFLLKDDVGSIVASQEDLVSLINELTRVESDLNNKVDKVPGKGLSTEDFTTELKNKLLSIENTPGGVTSVNGKTGDVTLSKGDVGLGSVQNYGIASQDQAEAGTANDVYMTPLRVAQAIAKMASGGNSGDGPKCAIGMWTGSGSGTKDIITGFRPGFVFVLTQYKSREDSPFVFYFPGRKALMVYKGGGYRDLDSSKITALSNGFRVGGTKQSGIAAFESLNAKRVYYYFALG